MLKTGLQTTGIDHTVLQVSDLARSKAFYMDLLGLTVNHESSWQAFLWCGDQMVVLFESAQGTPVTHGVELNHMALRLASGTYEEVKERLEEYGCQVDGRPGDDRCIYFNDPDGHRLQLLYPDQS